MLCVYGKEKIKGGYIGNRSVKGRKGVWRPRYLLKYPAREWEKKRGWCNISVSNDRNIPIFGFWKRVKGTVLDLASVLD